MEQECDMCLAEIESGHKCQECERDEFLDSLPAQTEGE